MIFLPTTLAKSFLFNGASVFQSVKYLFQIQYSAVFPLFILIFKTPEMLAVLNMVVGNSGMYSPGSF
jgi:hypothetical protein